MTYRRRQGIARSSTFKEEPIHHHNLSSPDYDVTKDSSYSLSSSSLASQAIRASAAHRDSSSLSSAYGHSTFSSLSPSPPNSTQKGYPTYEYTSLRTANEPKGFWGVLAQKAKSILEDDNISQQFEATNRLRSQRPETATDGLLYQPYQSFDGSKKVDNPRLRKGLDALTNSLNQISDTIGNVIEEGRKSVEIKTQGLIQETRRLQIGRKGSGGFEEQNLPPAAYNPWQQQSIPTQPQLQTKRETQLKASRDVAMATAAKAKLLLCELKTVKADLAFTKERCSQLEEENKILRESRDMEVNPADDDMIRLQLETLLAEKASLAHENSVYARENRFLREIVEYHQLTMHNILYLDEGIEDATDDYPFHEMSGIISITPPSPSFPEFLPSVTLSSKIDSSQSEAPLQDPQTEKPKTPTSAA